jgi:hypothetical protein
VAQKVTLKAKGLFSFPNQLSAVPEGALVKADNIVINRDGIIESQRGFNAYGDSMSGIAKQLFSYKNKILRHFNNTLQFDDGSGTFTSFDGQVVGPVTSGVYAGARIKSIESNGNLYLTTEDGIKKISSLTPSSLSNAGVPKALTMELELEPGDEGFMTPETVVAYKIVWGIKDVNNNLIFGAPSQTEIIEFPLLNSLIVDFNSLINKLETDLDVDYPPLEITEISPIELKNNLIALCTQLTTLSDDKFTEIAETIQDILFEINPTSSQLFLLKEQFDEIVLELNRLIGNVLSPDITTYSLSTELAKVNIGIYIPEEITPNHFYQVHRTALASSLTLADANPGEEFRLVWEANPTQAEIDNDELSFSDVYPEELRNNSVNLYTNENTGEGILQANDPIPQAKDITLYKNYLFLANTKTRHRKTITLAGFDLITLNQSKLYISDGGLNTTQYVFSNEEEDAVDDVVKFKVGDDDLTPSQRIDDTARSLVRMINKNDPLVYAYYVSETNQLPGQILLERQSNIEPFYVYVDIDDTGKSFTPNLPISQGVDSAKSDNDVAPNRIYYAKRYKPEAIPYLNYFDVGPREKQILRIIALRDSLFVLKEEGVYRVSGDSAPFIQTLFDSSVIVTAPDSATVLNNQIYVLTSQGVVEIGENGVQIISRPIEGDLTKLANYPNFKKATFGVAYESDRTYYLWTVTDRTDSYATQCFKYNTFTSTWVRSLKTNSCAVVHSFDDKMYIGATDINFIEKERKNFDRTDYSDREYNLTLGSNSVNGTEITLPSVANIKENDVIVQEQYLTITQFNRLLLKLDRDDTLNQTDYFTSLKAINGDNLRIKLSELANKLDTDNSDGGYFLSITTYDSSFEQTQQAFNVIVNKLNNDNKIISTNFLTSDGTILYEVIVKSVNRSTNKIIVEYEYPFIVGKLTVYSHIECEIAYAPHDMGDSSLLKQFSEAALIFDKISFSKCIMGFATDLNPQIEEITFQGTGNDLFGHHPYGTDNFGGDGNSVPFRTLVPQQKQRCRYLNVSFKHQTARELFALYGISLTANSTSTRGYR